MIKLFKKIYCILLPSLYQASMLGVRDPFGFAPSPNYVYTCDSIGVIRYAGKPAAFARLAINGTMQTVKVGDSLKGHTVLAIHENKIILKDDRGLTVSILLENKALQLK